MGFREIKIEELDFNPFVRIGKQWMLITAGNEAGFNTMTASWGGAGVLWGKNAVTVYIRPQRYTKEFVDKNDVLTISFYPEEYKKALGVLGSVSGRERDKVAETKMTPYFTDGTAAFEEAELILVCKKMYEDEIKPEKMLAKEQDERWYPEKDYHTMYICEVTKVLVKEA